MESRRKSSLKSSSLPQDFLKLVNEVFNANFDTGLKSLGKLTRCKHRFEASGAVFADEIVLSVSLLQEKQISATTAYASCDFDPKASSPTIQDLLSLCVDASGAIFGQLFEPKKIPQLAEDSLSALENIPFDWTPMEIEKKNIFLKVDKANPSLDQMTEDWLEKNDPDLHKIRAQEEAETEALFITGPKSPKKGPVH